jgi:hypothetical protein
MQTKASVRRWMGVAALLAAVAGTGVANAQSGEGFDKPLKGQKSAQGGHATMMMSESDDEHTYTVRIDGDTTTAEIDGKAVPKDRVRNKNGKVEILDEDGKVIKSFNLPAMGQSRMFRLEGFPGGQGGVLAPGGAWVENFQPPKAMMGITMSDAGDDEGVTVDTVMEDMPAAKAGLKSGDRIVKANGKDINNSDDLREVIRTLEAGDTLNLKVDRDGKSQDLKVKLAKWEQKGVDVFAGPQAGTWQGFNAFGGGEQMDAARKAIEKAMSQLKEEKIDAKVRERVHAALTEAMKSLEQAHRRTVVLDQDAPNALRFYGDKGNAFTLRQRAGDDGEIVERLDKLSEKLDRLNKRLDDLEKKNR